MSFKNNYKELAKKVYGKHYNSQLKELIGEGTINSIIRGSDIGVSAAYKVAKALNTNIEHLITGVRKERRTYQRRESDKQGVLIDRRKNGRSL